MRPCNYSHNENYHLYNKEGAPGGGGVSKVHDYEIIILFRGSINFVLL